MKTPTLLIASLAFSLGAPLWAGTQVKAHLESDTDPSAWVDVTVSIAKGRLRMDYQGPKTRGTLFYYEKTSLLLVVDKLKKTVLPITASDQSTLKFIGAMGSGKIDEALAKGQPEDQRLYELVKSGAKAFFNGNPTLKKKGDQKDGFTCDLYRTELDRKMMREVWIAPPQKAGVAKEDYQTFLGLVDLLLDVSGGVLFEWGAQSDVFRRRVSSSRLPVSAVLYEKGNASGRYKVLAVKTGNFPKGAFDPPKGYTRKSLRDLIGLGKGT